MRPSRFLIALLTGLMLAAPAVAGPATMTADVTGGSLGVGPEGSFRANDMIGLRANATFLHLTHGFTSNGLRYTGRARLKSYGAMVDVYPFANGFRISAGARLNRNRGHVSATPAGNTVVGRMTYTPAQIGTIEGDASVKRWAPALTLGYAGHNRRGFSLGVEAGALFQGRVTIAQLTNSTGMIRAADLENERIDIQNEVDHYRVYPILQLTAGYRF